MQDRAIAAAFEAAKERYAAMGVDVESAIRVIVDLGLGWIGVVHPVGAGDIAELTSGNIGAPQHDGGSRIQQEDTLVRKEFEPRHDESR